MIESKVRGEFLDFPKAQVCMAQRLCSTILWDGQWATNEENVEPLRWHELGEVNNRESDELVCLCGLWPWDHENLPAYDQEKSASCESSTTSIEVTRRQRSSNNTIVSALVCLCKSVVACSPADQTARRQSRPHFTYDNTTRRRKDLLPDALPQQQQQHVPPHLQQSKKKVENVFRLPSPSHYA